MSENTYTEDDGSLTNKESEITDKTDQDDDLDIDGDVPLS